MPMVVDRRLYLTRDKSRIVEEGDPSAGYLFAAPGHVISDADAERYDLCEEPEPEPELEPEPEPSDEVGSKMSDDIEDKMAPEPENKVVTQVRDLVEEINKKTKRRRKRKSKD